MSVLQHWVAVSTLSLILLCHFFYDVSKTIPQPFHCPKLAWPWNNWLVRLLASKNEISKNNQPGFESRGRQTQANI
jgi:hypothetical protein